MSVRRAAAPPPSIPGYRYVSLLGSGGFADVYLYEQDRPRRQVAVKVLISDLKTEGARRAFESEANLMAQLSSHPYIVTIYEADTTDEGHSYLAMEYCSRPSLDIRYRRARLSVAETLTIGIQVSSAVESAHRAGIAHRDIKPANILVTDYNRPALTDFGISGTMESSGTDEDQGMSIPWSPPEAFHGGGIDGVKVDVWALGATVYTLLAGRSPFVFPGMDNSQAALMDRIATMPLQRTGREDVPDSLELAMATAMSKQPGSRFESAYSFALTLQRIQTELGYSVTPFEVLDEAPQQYAGEDGGAEETRVRRVVSIDPESTTFAPTFPNALDRGVGSRSSPSQGAAFPDHTATGSSTGRRTADQTGTGTPPAPAPAPAPLESAGTGWGDRTVLRGAATPPEDSLRLDTTLHRPAPGGATAAGPAEPARRRRLPLLIGVGSLVLLGTAGGVAAVVFGGSGEEPAPPPGLTQPPSDPMAGLEGNVPPPEGIAAAQQGNDIAFTWRNPDPQDGDIYRFRTVTVQETGEWVRTQQLSAVVQSNPSGTTCLDVQLARGNGTASEPARSCYPE
ncbi:serine/threonine protein kinase [Arthrobacter sp. NamB2]|uniref:protein kinase domain-containing protein n=1 Tax=Arthrobacter sp. NamB2 TaxID=2576035 RepID=UPI0010C93D44|nr:protein kinase [Arthrobacter sp. NamB2]TKV27859.1 serine/threonine protein kinase [Arthrobacter sp. NamB2]